MFEIDGQTKLCALFGNPVEHSVSPIIHNAALEKLGLNCRYVCLRLEEENVGKAVDSIRTLGLLGVNVTVPYKQTVLPYLDKIDPVAVKIGAVNTIVNNNGVLIGYNTDWLGFVNSLEEKVKIKDKKIVLVGAGGVARAMIYGMKERGGNITIINRTIEKAQALAVEFGCEFEAMETLARIKGDILVNATCLGMSPEINKSIILQDRLSNFSVVFDTIYNPLKTKLLREAEAEGLLIVPGLKMLIYQGAAAFRLWLNQEPDIVLMTKVAERWLKEKYA
jgi:shikimate dehydrogenase